jgi:hypothetical protein
MSTIAAKRLDCRVRNGIGYNPPAKPPTLCARFARQNYVKNIGYALPFRQGEQKLDCAIQSSAQETGSISTPPLNALRHFYVEPINLVIFEGSHNDY